MLNTQTGPAIYHDEYMSYSAWKASNISVPQLDHVELYGLSFQTYTDVSLFFGIHGGVVSGFLSERFRIFLRC